MATQQAIILKFILTNGGSATTKEIMKHIKRTSHAVYRSCFHLRNRGLLLRKKIITKDGRLNEYHLKEGSEDRINKIIRRDSEDDD